MKEDHKPWCPIAKGCQVGVTHASAMIGHHAAMMIHHDRALLGLR